MAEARSSGLAPRRQLPVLGTADLSRAAELASLAAGSATRTVRVGFVTLGCDKNTVDSERLLAHLLGAGATLCADPADADVVVVNTCGFIEAAKEESIEAILDAARLKQAGRVRAVVATGCLVQRYRAELTEEMPEVDLFLGLTDADRLVPELRRRGLLHERDVPVMERPLRVLSSRTRHTSYLKISEGCDHTCAFCAIPLMRGKFRSTPADLLVAEARELAAQGVVELNIVSQDTTWYGRDVARGRLPEPGEYFVGATFVGMAGIESSVVGSQPSTVDRIPSTVDRIPSGVAAHPTSLDGLLRRLLAETDVPWLRLFYMYPSGISRELVELMATEPRLLPYLDMPIQHGSDRMLTLMRRPERQATIRERVGWLRDSIPHLSLRTTLIVGFPGETDEDFEDMLALLEEVRFDRVGAFTYSKEEGTRAAALEAQVPAAVKRERLERLLEVQAGISLERNERHVGRTVRVLVDRIEADGSAVGRTTGQALEVDGVTLVRGAGAARPGDFLDVRIVDALEDDLIGERVA
ncbi:MAG TPA: MiaB/RimO family radical SAM methylthiotransferase [Longimicrobiales bacterium]|nr:MiaB/RimO family radical SAM methylthiotransferase [Longimicrobiales bacterium]